MLLTHATAKHIEQIVSFNDSLRPSSFINIPYASGTIRLVWHILEMHHPNPEPLKTMASITDNILSDDVDRLILPHMSLAAMQYRLTVFGLC
jgi:hypothetical protein